MNATNLYILFVAAQVTFVTSAALILIRLARRQSAFRHLTGVIGLVLTLSSPILSLALPRPAWLFVTNADSRFDGVDTKAKPVTHSDIRAPLRDQGRPPLSHAGSLDISTDKASDLTPAGVTNEDMTVAERPTTVVETVREGRPASGQAVAVPVINSTVDQRVDPGNRRETFLPFLFNGFIIAWCLGIAYTAYRESRSRQELKRILRSSSPWVSDRADRLKRDVGLFLGMTTLPEIRVTERTPLPFLLGTLRPVVILPRGIADSASDGRLRDILIHECAHVARKDPWVHLLQRISAILFWMHPGVHWLNSEIGRAREELCDNCVLRKGEATAYAELLLELAESCSDRRFGLSVLGLFSLRWTLEQRISGLLDPLRDLKTRVLRGTVVLLTALFCLLSLSIGGLGLGLPKSSVVADEKPVAKVDQNSVTVVKQVGYQRPAPLTQKKTIRGQCVDEDSKPISNVHVRIVRESFIEGAMAGVGVIPMSTIAEARSDAEGRFTFVDIEISEKTPFAEHQRQLFVAAAAEGRASQCVQFGLASFDETGHEVEIDPKEPIDLGSLVLSSEPQVLSGIVTDSSGKAVSGAYVYWIAPFEINPIPGMWSSITNRDGRYSIKDLERWKPKPPKTTIDEDGHESTYTEMNRGFLVVHPDYGRNVVSTEVVPNQVNVTLMPVAVIEGHVVDRVTGLPAASVVVRAKGITRDGQFQTKTDQNGRYELRVSKDYYSLWVEAENRIAVVLKEIEALPGKPVTDANFELLRGGFVVGKVIDEETGKPLAQLADKPTIVAHYGPACIKTQVLMWTAGEPPLTIGVQQTTKVEPDGTFRLRVAPGRNCVFFLQDYGEVEQSYRVVSVEDGQEQRVELRVKLRDLEEQVPTRELAENPIDEEFERDMEHFAILQINSNAEEAELVAKREPAPVATADQRVKPKKFRIPSRERPDTTVFRLLDKFERKTIVGSQYGDEWLRTIKEIVDLGPAAVPELIEELDATDDVWVMQVLGFVLRAINDRRAIPALIRAIPKALPPPEPRVIRLEDMLSQRHWPTSIMLHTDNPELLEFARKYETGTSRAVKTAENRFDYESTIEELCGAITKMTGASNGERELFDLAKGHSDSEAEIREKQLQFDRVGKAWAEWWQLHQNDEFVNVEETPEEAEAIKFLEQEGCDCFRDGSLPGRPIVRIQCERKARLTTEILSAMKKLKSLQVLFPPGNVEITQDQLSQIGELHSLTEFHTGARLKLSGPRLKVLLGLTNLKILGLVGSEITNDDLIDIGQLTSLTRLQSSGRAISDTGMKHLLGLQNLTKLDLSWHKITNVGLADVCELKNLTQLILRGTNVNDAGLQSLKSLKRLAFVDLSDTKITGAGFKELRDLPGLSTLKLENTMVGDTGLKEISELTTLRNLYLENTKITDDAIDDLVKLKNLKYLYIPETEISHEGLLKLKKALPDASVRDKK